MLSDKSFLRNRVNCTRYSSRYSERDDAKSEQTHGRVNTLMR